MLRFLRKILPLENKGCAEILKRDFVASLQMDGVGFHVWHTIFLCLAPLFEELTVVTLTPKRDWREWRVRIGSLGTLGNICVMSALPPKADPIGFNGACPTRLAFVVCF
ncbi:MAG: hypothetical protein WBX35_25005, partial [Pseudolabrys sp.]